MRGRFQRRINHGESEPRYLHRERRARTTKGTMPRSSRPSMRSEYHLMPASFTGSARPPSGITRDHEMENLRAHLRQPLHIFAHPAPCLREEGRRQEAR